MSNSPSFSNSHYSASTPSSMRKLRALNDVKKLRPILQRKAGEIMKLAGDETNISLSLTYNFSQTSMIQFTDTVD